MNLAQKTVFKSEELNFIIKNGYKDKSNEGVANFPEDAEENNAEHQFDVNPDDENNNNLKDDDNGSNRLQYLNNLDV